MKKTIENLTKYYGNNRAVNNISFTIPKGKKALVEEYAAAHDGSVNGVVNRLLRVELGISEEDWKRPAEDSREP